MEPSENYQIIKDGIWAIKEDCLELKLWDSMPLKQSQVSPEDINYKGSEHLFGQPNFSTFYQYISVLIYWHYIDINLLT